MVKLYIGNNQVNDIFAGSNRVNRIYKGSQIIYSKYQPNDIIFESSTAGTYNVNLLLDGVYLVYVIGAGTGAGAGRNKINIGTQTITRYCMLSGSSGAGFIGEIQLNKGTYLITVGQGSSNAGATNNNVNYSIGNAGSSSIGNLVIANGGIGGYANRYGNSYNYSTCKGGTAPTISAPIISTRIRSAGIDGLYGDNGGMTYAGARSVVDETVYGEGGSVKYDNFAYNGSNGYVRIIFKDWR